MLQIVQQRNVVLLIGSAPDAVRCVSFPRSSFRTIVAFNNAWRVRPDWDVLVHAGDLACERLEAELAKPTPSPDVIALQKAEAIATLDRLQLHMATLRPIEGNDVTRITSNG